MQKLTLKSLLIVGCGSLLFVLLSWVIPNSFAYARIMVICLSIISIAAILFGGKTGGLIGWLGIILFLITMIIKKLGITGLIINYLFLILLVGFYGLLFGNISGKILAKTKDNSLIKNTVCIFFIVIGFSILFVILQLAAGIILDLISNVIRNTLSNMKYHGFDLEDLLNSAYFAMSHGFKYLNINVVSEIIQCLSVAVISAITFFVYAKINLKKGIPSGETDTSSEVQITTGTLFEGGILGFVQRAFRVVFEFSLWLSLFFSIIFVSSIGNGICFFVVREMNISELGGVGIRLLSFILGCFVGLVNVVLYGGIVATFLNINKNLEIIAKGNLQKKSITN